MRVLDWARRLLSASALLLLGGVAISIMTRDAWLLVSHVVAVASAVFAAIAVMLLAMAGLRRLGVGRAPAPLVDLALAPHEMGLTGLEAPADPAQTAASDGP